jgi:hypothetical protein
LFERRPSSGLSAVSADDVDDIAGGFLGGFGIARHVVVNVVFHQLGHEAVDGTARGGEALEGLGARRTLSSWPMTFLVPLTRSNFSREVCDILLAHAMG